MRVFWTLPAVILPLLSALPTVAQTETADLGCNAPPAMAMWSQRAGWEEIGRYSPAAPTELEVAGNIAYLGSGSRLEAIDLSDPAQPRLLAHLDLPSAVSDLFVRGDYVYVAVRNAGLAIVETRGRGRLKLVGWSPSPNVRWDSSIRIDLAGDTVYCTGLDLTVVDIGNPARPRVVTRIADIVPRDVTVADRRLYVACNDAVRVYDITAPRAPALLAQLDQVGFRMADRIQAHGGRLYLMGSGCFTTWNLDGPLVPEATRSSANIFGWGDIAFHGVHAFVAGASLLRLADGYELFDWRRDWWDWYENLPGDTWDAAVTGDILVAVRGEGGLVTYSLAGEFPQRLGFYTAGMGFHDVAVAGGRAWLATGHGGLNILDVSNPRHPRVLGELTNDDARVFDRADWPGSIRVCRQHALIYSRTGGLRVVDGTDPAAPRLVFSTLTSPDGRTIEYPLAIAVADGWLVTCNLRCEHAVTPAVLAVRLDADGAVTLAEVAWPAGLPTANMRHDGRHGYAIDPVAGLVVFDADATGTVSRLGTVNHGWSTVRDVALDRGFAYVAHVQTPVGSAIDVVDISDPVAPRWVGTTGPMETPLSLPPLHLGASDGMVFLLNEYGDVGLVDMTRPDAPAVVASTFAPGAPWSLTMADGMAYVGSFADGLRILQAHRAAAAQPSPPPSTVLAVSPNPCNPRATISFNLAAAGPATVRVFDARGRLVRHLHDGWLDAGAHAMAWSGDDDAGRPTASGVYLVRAGTADRNETVRVTVVR